MSTEADIKWTVPRNDAKSFRASVSQVVHLESYYRHLTGNTIAVQAGGNIGVWPRHMSSRFEAVYTFEPNHENFYCLAINCAPKSNIYPFRAGLGKHRGWSQAVFPEGKENNYGAIFLDGKGNVPVMTIDSLDLPACDFIMLDIEGMECAAVEGAAETIRRFRPLVVCEDKGHSVKFGYAFGAIVNIMREFGYKQVEAIHRDRVFTCS